jgi:predicted Zn-ribbon and HTH transcriptional regulator
MKRISLLVVIGLILSFKLEAKKIEGRIIFENDTIDVTFNIPIKFFTQEPNYEKLQYKVKYFDSAGNKIILRPDKAKEIQFKYEYENVRMLSRYNSLGLGNIFSMSTNIFLKLEIDGELKLFNYYYTQHSAGAYNASTGMMTGGYSYRVERLILQKGNGELKRPKGLTFKKDMINYFSDCPKLVEKIESKDFRKDDLESIVRFYNSNCR